MFKVRRCQDNIIICLFLQGKSYLQYVVQPHTMCLSWGIYVRPALIFGALQSNSPMLQVSWFDYPASPLVTFPRM